MGTGIAQVFANNGYPVAFLIPAKRTGTISCYYPLKSGADGSNGIGDLNEIEVILANQSSLDFAQVVLMLIL